MRYTILILAVTLTAGTTEARADMVAYNMTGTITNAWNAPNSSFAVGDHISWTLQYDNSTPISTSGTAAAGSWAGYSSSGYMLTNIVDQTTGYHFPILPPSDMGSSGISLMNNNPGYRNISWGEITAGETAMKGFGYYESSLKLLTAASLPTLDLAKFSFDKLPVIWNSNPSLYSGTTQFDYIYQGSNLQQIGITATVDSIPGVHMVPEPGSLTLFLLGAAGLAVIRLRSRFGFVRQLV